MAPLWLLIIVVYLHNAKGNAFLEEAFSDDASEVSDQDANYDLYRVLLGNAQFEHSRNDVHNDHILRERSKSTERRELEDRKKRYRLEIIHANHMKRVNELIKFMKTNILSTEYFYAEMERIKRQHKIKDNLRMMVEYAEKKPEMKQKILKCYYDLRDLEPKRCQLLKCKKPNTLAINDILP